MSNQWKATAALASAGLVWMAVAMQETPAPPTPPAAPPVQPQRSGTSADLGRLLVSGLRETEGCLGVDSGGMSSGKNIIVAWFEDKQAAKRWYYHPTHKRLMSSAGGMPEDEPMQHVPDGIPVMVIASITPSDAPRIEGVPMPISAIAIEIFTPVPGGAFVNDRFSPATFVIPHMRDYTAPAPAEDAASE